MAYPYFTPNTSAYEDHVVSPCAVAAVYKLVC
jgi:hypothetical protein